MIEKIRNLVYKLLRRSEKYTKTDMVYLAKGGFWLTSGQIFTSLSTLTLAIAFANLLPKDIYGQYKYILSILTIFSLATLSGMDSSITRAVARGNEGSFLPALKTKIKWGLLGSIASLFFTIYYFLNQDYSLAASFALVIFITPLFESLLLYQAYFNGQKKFTILTKFTIISSLVNTLVIITTIYLTDNLFLILCATFLPLIIVRAIYLLIILKKHSPNKQVDQETVKYGKHLSLVNVLGTLAMQIDKVLIFHYLGTVELAIYAFAIAPLEQMKSLFKPLITLAIPKFATKKLAEIKNTLIAKVLKLCGIMGLISVIYIYLSPYIFRLLFPEYLDSVFYSQIFAISFATLPLLTITAAFEAQKMIREIYFFKLTADTTQILITFTLIYYYGLLGAVLSRVIIRFFDLILLLFMLKKAKQ